VRTPPYGDRLTRDHPVSGRWPRGRRQLRTRTYGSEEGSLSAFVVLLLVAVIALMGLVVDGGSALNARQSAADEAEQAARAGAGALSVDALRSGSIQINQAQAIEAAEQFTAAAGHPGTVTVSGGTVTVSIRYRIPTDVLGIVGISTLPVSAAASAVDLEGVSGGP
jgi:Flp pilus assembly protein TadG